MTGAEHSLLSFLDAPVVVGDPDGRAVFVNPAFESRFATARDAVMGRRLAELFEGGGREAVLQAVASVCQGGESVRFRVRERGVGFAAVASPIVAEDAQVGVVILLKEEVDGAERLLALQREIQDPLAELTAALEALLEQTGGRRADRYRTLVEDGMRSLSRLRKWSDEMGALLAGSPAAQGDRFDPAEALRHLARRCRAEAEPRRVAFALLAAPSLTPVEGDRGRLESILVKMLRRRFEQEPRPLRVTLGARTVVAEGSPAVLISLAECFGDEGFAGAPGDPPEIKEALASLGAELQVTSDPQLGRATLLRLPAAEA